MVGGRHIRLSFTKIVGEPPALRAWARSDEALSRSCLPSGEAGFHLATSIPNCCAQAFQLVCTFAHILFWHIKKSKNFSGAYLFTHNCAIALHFGFAVQALERAVRSSVYNVIQFEITRLPICPTPLHGVFTSTPNGTGS